MRKIQAGNSTANAARPMTEVMNQPQALSGSRIRDMPLQRMSRVVVMKFKAPSNCPMQKRQIELAQRITPRPWPGPPASPIALNGAYCVQPPRVGPLPVKNDATRTRKATKVTQNDIMLNRGNGMSSAPAWKGRKKLPNAANGAVVRTKKTMVVPCMVIGWRAYSGVNAAPG